MQTFLPYEEFRASAEVLDRQRLGCQRVEAYQILRTLLGESDGWKHHPAVRMWAGYEAALLIYLDAICDEWRRRGYWDTVAEKAAARFKQARGYLAGLVVMPPWLGDREFHASHRAALLAKNPEHYGRFGWPETPCVDYVWPAAARSAEPPSNINRG